jgi:hypothetical protein
MKHTESPKAGLGRRGFFAGLAAGLGIAALAAGARKVHATAQKRLRGPELYRHTAEADRYFKTMD